MAFAGNPPETDEFPAQRASNAKNVSFDDVIMYSLSLLLQTDAQAVCDVMEIVSLLDYLMIVTLHTLDANLMPYL